MTYSYDLKIKILKCIKLNKYTDGEIMEIFHISKNTFYKIKKGNFSKSLKRKTKITPLIEKYIINYVLRKSNFYYVKLINLVLKNFNVHISKTTIYRILKKNKIKKKKIYEKLILGDPIKRNNLIQIFKKQINDTPIENIVSIDETSINTYISYNYAWSRYGSKTVNKKTHKKIRYTVISAVDINGNIYNKIIKGSCNGEIFLAFIKTLLKKLSLNHKWSLLIDNARIHHYKKLKNFINEQPNINIIYNVPYSPESNPIERVFNEAKHYLKKMKFNNDNILGKINRSFKLVKKDNVKQYFYKSINFY